MEIEEVQRERVHHGHNVRRVRREKGIKQDVLADSVHLGQQSISRYESMKEIDDEMLGRFAKALGVPVEYLKTLEEDAPIMIFENNTAESQYGNANTNVAGTSNDNVDNSDNSTKTFNPMEKVVELYERLLSQEKEKQANLEERLSALEEKFGSK